MRDRGIERRGVRRRRSPQPSGPRRRRCSLRPRLAAQSENSRPSSDSRQAIGSPTVPPRRWSARPSTPPSQPTPTAPGPNRPHIRRGHRGVLEHERRRSLPCPRELDLDFGDVGRAGHLAVDPGRAQPVRPLAGHDLAAGVAFELVSPAHAVVAADRQEPSADPLRVGQGVPDVLDGRVVGAFEADGPPLPRRDPAGADCRASRLRVHGRCRSIRSSFDLSVPAAPMRRWRFPRASSVASESSRCSQKRRNWSSHTSTSGAVPSRRRRGVGRLGPDAREAALPQDLEVLRDGRLRDPELGLDDAAQRPEVSSPSASSSRIRRRTGSPRTSKACIAHVRSIGLYKSRL